MDTPSTENKSSRTSALEPPAAAIISTVQPPLTRFRMPASPRDRFTRRRLSSTRACRVETNSDRTSPASPTLGEAAATWSSVMIFARMLGISSQNSSHSRLPSSGAFSRIHASRACRTSCSRRRASGPAPLRRRPQYDAWVQVPQVSCPFSRQQTATGHLPMIRQPPQFSCSRYAQVSQSRPHSPSMAHSSCSGVFHQFIQLPPDRLRLPAGLFQVVHQGGLQALHLMPEGLDLTCRAVDAVQHHPV